MNGTSVHPAIVAVVALLGVIVLAATAGPWVADQIRGTDGKEGVDPAIRLRIVSPTAGAVVESPFTLEVASEGVTIADPAEGEDEAYHYHAFVDVHPFTAVGDVIPEGDGIYHFWGESLELDLPPGDHQVILVLGGNDDVRPAEAPVTDITVTVAER